MLPDSLCGPGRARRGPGRRAARALAVLGLAACASIPAYALHAGLQGLPLAAPSPRAGAEVAAEGAEGARGAAAPRHLAAAAAARERGDLHAAAAAPSLIAVMMRFDENITWLDEGTAGVVAAGAAGAPPRDLVPLIIYQAADLDARGAPTFPGLPADDADGEEEEEAEAEGGAAWPAWAAPWAAEKNATLAEAAPGSLEDARRAARAAAGLAGPDDVPAAWLHHRERVGADVDLDALAERVAARLEAHAAAKTEAKAARGAPPRPPKRAAAPPASPVVTVPAVSRRPLHIVPNRGAEAMAYISYIIEAYDALPDVVLFMHAHRRSWHMALPQDWALRRLAAAPPRGLAAAGGFMPLGCQERADSERANLWPRAIDANHASANAPHWHEALAARYAQAWREHLGAALGGRALPQHVRVPPGASFAATRAAIRRRPKAFYEGLRAWMLETTVESKWLGITLEFMAPLIFADAEVFNPSQEACLCALYSVCSSPAEI
jgi:hypothetical protein